MGASKLYKGKTCPYCGVPGSSTTADHVVARAFFFEEDRDNLPKVPACAACNNKKSALEAYVSAALMLGSQHAEARRFIENEVKPRLLKNYRLLRELGLTRELEYMMQWVNINGVVRQMVPIRINARAVQELMQLTVRGLHYHHFREALDQGFWPDVSMFPPEREAGMWGAVAHYFPPEAPRVGADLGRGSFVYAAARSPAHPGLSAWQMAWHGGISLHGEGGAGASHWWAFTRPTPDLLASLQV